MNIFACNDDPIIAAEGVPQKVAGKMALEAVQMLAVAFSEPYLNIGKLTRKDGGSYRNCHVNHPCTKWVRESVANIAWTILHGMKLCERHTERYGTIIHTQSVYHEAHKIFSIEFPGQLHAWKDHTPFVRAFGDQLNHLYDEILYPDTTKAYTEYLKKKWYYSL